MDKESLVVWMPLYVAVIVFIADYFYKDWVKRENKLSELKSDLFYVTDKMIKRGVSAEYATIFYRFHDVIRHEFKLDSSVATTSAYENAEYYQRKADEDRKEFELLKADFKKCVLDLNIYWNNHSEKCDIIDLLRQIGLQTPRHFNDKYVRQFNSIKELKVQYEKDRLSVESEFYMSGVGLNLLMIQKRLDVNATKFYMKPDQELKLNEIIHKLKCSEKCCHNS